MFEMVLRLLHTKFRQNKKKVKIFCNFQKYIYLCTRLTANKD